MSGSHSILVTVSGMFFLSKIVVYIGGVFKTRNQTWNTVFIMTGVIIFVPGLIMGIMALIG